MKIPIFGGYLNGSTVDVQSVGGTISPFYRALRPHCDTPIVFAKHLPDVLAMPTDIVDDYVLKPIGIKYGSLELTGWVYAYQSMDKDDMHRSALAYILAAAIGTVREAGR